MNSVNEPNKLQHNERSKYSDQSEIRVLTTGGTLEGRFCQCLSCKDDIVIWFQYSRIVIEQCCMSHKSKKSDWLQVSLNMSYDFGAAYPNDDDAIFL